MTSASLPDTAARSSRVGRASRTLLGLALVAGGVAKLAAPAALAAHAVVLFGIDPSSAPRVAAAVRAAAAFELATGLLALAASRIGTWTVWLTTCVAAFTAWDAVRFVLGDDPDCGCLGTLLTLPTWSAVAAKDVVLCALLATVLRATGREERPPAG